MKWLEQNGNVRWTHCLLLAFMLVLIWPAKSSAYRATEYRIDQNWPTGSVVAVDDQGKLVLASLQNQNYVGVVAEHDTQAVQVADEASSIPVLVSQNGGDIKAGDRLGLSAVAGVATKWQPGMPLIAVAKQEPTKWESTTSQLDNGQPQKVSLALIDAQLLQAVGSSQSGESAYMGTVQKAANQLAGHSVAVWQISLALVLGLAGIVLSVGLLFIASRESFFSIGRNPLAGNTIMSSLWKMSGVSVVILLVSLTSAYLILRIGG